MAYETTIKSFVSLSSRLPASYSYHILTSYLFFRKAHMLFCVSCQSADPEVCLFCSQSLPCLSPPIIGIYICNYRQTTYSPSNKLLAISLLSEGTYILYWSTIVLTGIPQVNLNGSTKAWTPFSLRNSILILASNSSRAV